MVRQLCPVERNSLGYITGTPFNEFALSGNILAGSSRQEELSRCIVVFIFASSIQFGCCKKAWPDSHRSGLSK